MFNKSKYLFIILAIVLQLGTIIAIFYNLSLAKKLGIAYGVVLIILISLFIIERRLEKKEEIHYDDFDY